MGMAAATAIRVKERWPEAKVLAMQQLAAMEEHGAIGHAFNIANARSTTQADLLAALAEREGHHPDLHIEGYRHVRIEITTHANGPYP